ncbi:hypothetical protein NL676_039287 [Syzygium grande]|nr:hypothetical protein NL676_039287 [Syzygium grande]
MARASVELVDRDRVGGGQREQVEIEFASGPQGRPPSARVECNEFTSMEWWPVTVVTDECGNGRGKQM